MAKKATAHNHPAIVAATIGYERWLHERLDVVKDDLDEKHRQMTRSLFAFLRATFYRWGPLWLEVCSHLAEAPRLLAVGDLHVENFGTWRDTEGRLVWGVNDFDEVAEMPYTLDLVRLVTSAILAKHENDLAIDASSAAAAVLDGYAEALKEGGKPFILEESHPDLREMALGAERDPVHFWSKLTRRTRSHHPNIFRDCCTGRFPMGRRRSRTLIASPEWEALAGRDMSLRLLAKAVSSRARRRHGCPRLGVGPRGGRRNALSRFGCSSIRCGSRTPTTQSRMDGWFAGSVRIADASNWRSCPKRRDERLLLRDMGRETANLHLATSDQRDNMLHDLSERKTDWLLECRASHGEGDRTRLGKLPLLAIGKQRKQRARG